MSYEIRAASTKEMACFLAGKGIYHSVFANEDHLPCFAHRVNIPGDLFVRKDIRTFIDIALKAKTGNVECICISVTQKDHNHLNFLEVAEEYKATIIGPFASIHGKYNCWAAFFTKKHAEDAVRRVV